MDIVKERLWLWQKQGLDGSLEGKPSHEVLAKTGWSRSVGGVNPYLAIFARSGLTYEQVEQEAGRMEVYELPSARGCTYVVPHEHFGIALAMAKGTIDEAPMKTASKFLGVTPGEIDLLKIGILKTLEKGAMTPTQLKKELGDLVRNLGEEGKKRGQTTTLSLGLAPLQVGGQIVRVPTGGGFITQNYSYRLWKNGPQVLDREQAETELANLYFKWCGPATVKAFQWLSALNVGQSKRATESANLTSLEDGRLIHKDDLEAYKEFTPKPTGRVVFAGSLDNLNHLRLQLQDLIDEGDRGVKVVTSTGSSLLGGLNEFYSHMIVCDGRIIGMWEYDQINNKLVYCTWVSKGAATEEAAKATESYVQNHLGGDARIFSLDSPASRGARIKVMNEIGKA